MGQESRSVRTDGRGWDHRPDVYGMPCCLIIGCCATFFCLFIMSHFLHLFFVHSHDSDLISCLLWNVCHSVLDFFYSCNSLFTYKILMTHLPVMQTKNHSSIVLWEGIPEEAGRSPHWHPFTRTRICNTRSRRAVGCIALTRHNLTRSSSTTTLKSRSNCCGSPSMLSARNRSGSPSPGSTVTDHRDSTFNHFTSFHPLFRMHHLFCYHHIVPCSPRSTSSSPHSPVH